LVTDLFDTVEYAIEYDEYSGENSIFYTIGDMLQNNDEYEASIAISNLGSMMKSVFGNSVVSNMVTSDYLEETSILDQIDAIRSYGITNFCEQIKIDDDEGGFDTINELIAENTGDDEYISIGAGLNALVVFVRKIINENNFEFVEMMINPEIDDSDRLLQISLFIEDDIDAMNAWKVISGHTKVFMSVLRDIVLEDIDLEYTAFSNVEDILDDEFDYDISEMSTTEMPTTATVNSAPYRKRRDTFSDEREYEVSNLISTTYAIQMQFIAGIEMAMQRLVERLDFSSCDNYYSSYCLTTFFDELMENIDQTRIAIFCGDYPYLGNGETCNAWNDQYVDSVEGLTDYLEDIDDEYDESIEDEYEEKIEDEYDESIEDEYDEKIEDEYDESIEDEYDQSIEDEYDENIEYKYDDMDALMDWYYNNKGTYDQYETSDETYLERMSGEFTTEVPTEVMEVVVDERLITTSIVAVTVIFIFFILAIVSCVRLCRRNNVYNKYVVLDNESAYPGQYPSLDKRIDHV